MSIPLSLERILRILTSVLKTVRKWGGRGLGLLLRLWRTVSSLLLLMTAGNHLHLKGRHEPNNLVSGSAPDSVLFTQQRYLKGSSRWIHERIRTERPSASRSTTIFYHWHWSSRRRSLRQRRSKRAFTACQRNIKRPSTNILRKSCISRSSYSTVFWRPSFTSSR